MTERNDTVTAIEGIRVGHAVLDGISSGCTVILPEGGAVAAVDVRGGAPGTYGTDTLNPLNLVESVHGLFFTGGSAFGMNVAGGVMRFLAERDIGLDTGKGIVPIVAGAVIFDLPLNPSKNRPDADLGYAACLAADFAAVAEGNRGAGTGATVGKLYGMERAMMGGLGSACIEAPTGLKVGALMVVNAFGDIVDPSMGKIVAGCRNAPDGRRFIDTDRELETMTALHGFSGPRNTVVGMVATNAVLNKTQLTKVAQMAHDGLARTVYPAHTLYDGDTIFALSRGTMPGVDVNIVGTLAARAVASAILRGVWKARSLGGIPAQDNLK